MYRNDLIEQAMGNKRNEEVAYLSGMSFDTVRRARRGENLSVKSLSAIAKALNLDMQDLFAFDRAGSAQGENDRADSLSVQN